MQEATQGKIEVVDCSIRDGGLMNKWQFEASLVRDVIAAAVKAGCQYIELGYKASPEYFDPAVYGIWRFCNEGDLREFWGNEKLRGKSRLAIMLDIGRFHLAEMLPAAESVVSLIRVACYTHQIPEAVETTRLLADLGYQTTINIMAVSEADSRELETGLGLISRESPAKAVYVVDSYGSLNPEGVRGLVSWYRTLCPGKAIGFHGHNNQQLALANSLVAAEAGAAMLDASLLGMGRGAGNCNLELLLPQLGWKLEDLEDLLRVADRHLVALQAKLKWGYSLAYALAGLANQHPRKAMAVMDKDQGLEESGYLDEVLGNGVLEKGI